MSILKIKYSGIGFLYNLFSIFTIILLITLIVNALLPQLTLWIFHRNIVDYNNFRLIILPIILLFILLINERVFIRKDIFIPTTIISFYVFLLLILNFNNYEFYYLINGYNSFYYSIFILCISSLVRPFISYSFTLKVIITILITCSLIGIVQYMYNSPLLFTEDYDTHFKILSWMFYETLPYHVRAFSLFSISLEFGTFLVFCLGIPVFFFRKHQSRWFILAILIFIVGYFTITRNIYIGLLIALISTMFYTFSFKKIILLLLPVFSLIFGIFSSGGLGIASLKGITSNNTLNVRNYYWQREIKRQDRSDLLTLIFGDGRYQAGGEFDGSLLFVDNTYLQIIAQTGLLGLLAFLYFYFSLLRFIVYQPRNSIRSGLYGLLIAWPAMAMFNIMISQVALYSILVLLTLEDKKGVKIEKL